MTKGIKFFIFPKYSSLFYINILKVIFIASQSKTLFAQSFIFCSSYFQSYVILKHFENALWLVSAENDIHKLNYFTNITTHLSIHSVSAINTSGSIQKNIEMMFFFFIDLLYSLKNAIKNLFLVIVKNSSYRSVVWVNRDHEVLK